MEHHDFVAFRITNHSPKVFDSNRQRRLSQNESILLEIALKENYTYIIDFIPSDADLKLLAMSITLLTSSDLAYYHIHFYFADKEM